MRSSRARLLAGLTVSFAGVWMLASAQPAKELRSVVWGRAREALGNYRTLTDISGLVDVDSNIPKNIDAENLAAVCQARDEGVRRAKTWNEQLQLGLGIDDDPSTTENRALYATRLASIATYQGDVGTAIKQLTAAIDAMRQYATDDYPEMKKRYFATDEMLGATWLRAGEVENCLLMPNADRCLFPILPGGVHVKQEGAKRAAAIFTEYLKNSPDDLEVRWLLNLSYMLLGTYPQDVPPELLLKPEIFRSEIRMPRFMDVAAPTGFGTRDVAGGTIADDFDGDGLVDVILTSVDHCTAPHYFHNKGDGTFEDMKEAGLKDQFGAINAVQTDYNNDGKLDIFILRGGWEFPIRNSLMRNNGDNTFTDVTKEVGLSSGDQATHSAAWGDYDNDGWLDVFVAHELQPGQLFHNRGDGTFEDVTAKSGIKVMGVTKGVVFGDYDNDGYPDLYLSNVFGENQLYHNNRNGTFTEVGKQLGLEKPIISFPTWFFDYDNDGWLDIFVASYPNSVAEMIKYYLHMPALAETIELYHNNGNGTFTDVTKAVGLDRVVPAMGSNFGDLDNDGYLDVYLGTGTPSFAALMPNVMLKNVEGKRFVDVTEATGTGNLQKGHGIAFVDIDNDGDEDVLLNSGGAVPGDNFTESLYENPGAGGTNHWISVKLVGVKTNRPAIGAKITVHLAGDILGSPIRYREVTSGSSFGSNSFVQHIGLGQATIASLDIEWPTSRTHQEFKNVPVDSYLEIHEFDKTFSLRHPKKITLKHDVAAMQHDMTSMK
jgi:hypothetical protein